jgi:hypothetical protein
VETISSTSFFVLTWFGEAKLGGPGLTSGFFERWVDLNLGENCFQFAQLL